MECSIDAQDLFGPQVRLCRGGFDFTLLFEETILSIGPLALVLLFVPGRVLHLARSRRKVDRGLLHILKLFSFVVFGALQLALLVLLVLPETPTTRASIASVALAFCSTLAFGYLSHLEHERSVRPSSILNIYFLFTLVFDAARTRTLWSIPNSRMVAIFFTVTVGWKVLILLLEAKEKRSLLRPLYQHYPPEAISGVLNGNFFWWLNPLLTTGFGKVLFLDDLFPVDKDLTSAAARKGLQLRWETVNQRLPHALLWTIVAHYKWPLLLTIPPRLCLTAFTFAQPFLVTRILEFITQPDNPNSNNIGYGLIGAMALVYIGIAISTASNQHKTYRVITMVRGGLVSIIYRRTLDLSTTALDDSASVTLMSADVERIGTGMRYMHEAWASVVDIGLALWLLQRQLGLASAAPGVIFLVCTLTGLKVAAGAGPRQKLWLEAIQERVGVTAKMLGSMKGVKMSGLTTQLSANIKELRAEEIRSSRKYKNLLTVIVSLAYTTTATAPVVAFTVFILMARANSTPTLDTTRAFTSLTLFALLRQPMALLIEAAAGLMSAVGSLERIREYLSSESRMDSRKCTMTAAEQRKLDNWLRVQPAQCQGVELIDWPLAARSTQINSDKENCIVVENASVGWNEEKPFILKGLDFTIRHSALTIIIGPVGCGKSTLLGALLGETPSNRGSIQVAFTEAAYCSQTPWLTNDTMEQNILGTSDIDKRWYDTVIRACALEHDMRQFPKGDQSMVGSKGSVLSGGQQARLALARAVYARKKVVILDDVLSGLDPTTEENLFSDLFGPQGLFKQQGTTVILATNAVHRVSYADHIIALGNQGKIVEQGTFANLNSTSGYVHSLSLRNQSSKEKTKAEIIPATEAVIDLPATVSPIDPTRRTGDLTTYKYYIDKIGWLSSLLFLVLCALFVFGLTFPQIWVKWWAESNERHPNSRIGFYVGIYGGLGALAIVSLMLACWHLMAHIVSRSSAKFHKALLETVMSAPMSFFTTTDVGTTANRFSQDLQLIDMELPLSIFNTTVEFLSCLAQILLISISSKYIAPALPFCLLIFYLIQNFYLRTSRQLRFMEIEAKSPLFTRFLEALGGLPTIRAFGWEKDFERRNSIALDVSQKPYYLLYCVQRWLNLVLDLTIAVIAVVLVVITVRTKGEISPGLIGVALVNIVSFNTSVKALVTNWTILETSIGAVSRVRSFASETETENLPSETQMPPGSWPQNGNIEFRGVRASYGTKSKPVLRDVSLPIEAGQKIGICGRTGSGKSSLVSTLFRLLDLDAGSIVIDGIDISTIPRQEVRSRLIALPQEPYLLTGTVRENVDPFHCAHDEEIIHVLRVVYLWEIVQKKGGIDAEVDNEFLSHGQRQLICLARAMLRNSPILVLDEATSSVDVKTDELMQSIIRTHFRYHTIIAIAHRLDTVLQYDKIAVVEESRILEFDSPSNLLSRPSAFRALYRSLKNEDPEKEEEEEDIAERGHPGKGFF
ncbi:MAG: hypothetical protein M1837_006347 [Sclerophora amabilis]|nr:MAG: hypothetical protein M1837_006347 [Sclerophora amabilis]